MTTPGPTSIPGPITIGIVCSFVYLILQNWCSCIGVPVLVHALVAPVNADVASAAIITYLYWLMGTHGLSPK
jgi:hypothetical protein